ncbi:MAG: Arc family DNA-binding protein [Mesorhizobium sp.]|uniref:Arc family DNA-binding protein n=1 Tax=Mesorhizobium sp. TaxID=1871066 RepID=UPI001201E977|nr:MAG: Arc family DNA-binding protein [Mesorhizobium sp.]
MPQQYRPTIHVRVSPSLLRRLKIAASGSDRSMNAEIVARLERSFGPDDENRVTAMKLLTDALAILDTGSKD